VWLFGPVKYPEMFLSSSLEHEMREWEADFYLLWRESSPEKTMAVTPTWRESEQAIAQRLANELGRDFVVICQDRQTRSEHPATNHPAARAMRARATELDSNFDAIRDRVGKNSGSSFTWTPVRPTDREP